MTVGTARAGRRSFESVSAVNALEQGVFGAEVDSRWTIAGKPNGGYLLSMLARAAIWGTKHDHVIAASAHYLHSPEPGPVRIETESLREGRSASQVRARMEQDGAPCVEALITASHLDSTGGPHWEAGLPRRGDLGYQECSPVALQLPDGERVAILDEIEVRLEPASMGFTTGHPRGVGELRGWLALPGTPMFDPASLLFAADALPPATLDLEITGWVPTLELTVYVRALAVPGPVRVLQKANLVDDGRVDESCFVWDSSGRLVAQGTQLAGIRLGVARVPSVRRQPPD
jgi:Thioesterase-like superfamily